MPWRGETSPPCRASRAVDDRWQRYPCRLCPRGRWLSARECVLEVRGAGSVPDATSACRPAPETNPDKLSQSHRATRCVWNAAVRRVAGLAFLSPLVGCNAANAGAKASRRRRPASRNSLLLSRQLANRCVINDPIKTPQSPAIERCPQVTEFILFPLLSHRAPFYSL